MLHGDRAERRERRRLLQHPLGEVRVHPHALPLAGAERAAACPRSRSRRRAGRSRARARRAAASRTSASGSPSCAPAAAASSATARDVAERVRRLQVDEVRDREQRRVELLAGEHDRERRLGGDHRVPGARSSRGRRGSSRASVADELARASGSNCLPLRVARRARRPRRRRRRGARPRRTRRAARSARRSGSSSPREPPGQPRPSHCS